MLLKVFVNADRSHGPRSRSLNMCIYIIELLTMITCHGLVYTSIQHTGVTLVGFDLLLRTRALVGSFGRPARWAEVPLCGRPANHANVPLAEDPRGLQLPATTATRILSTQLGCRPLPEIGTSTRYPRVRDPTRPEDKPRETSREAGGSRQS